MLTVVSARRAGLFLGFGLSGVVPAVHYLYSEGWFNSVPLTAVGYLALMGALYVAGALLYAFRVPERWFPGKCDIYVSGLGVGLARGAIGFSGEFTGYTQLIAWRAYCAGQLLLLNRLMTLTECTALKINEGHSAQFMTAIRRSQSIMVINQRLIFALFRRRAFHSGMCVVKRISYATASLMLLSWTQNDQEVGVPAINPNSQMLSWNVVSGRARLICVDV